MVAIHSRQSENHHGVGKQRSEKPERKSQIFESKSENSETKSDNFESKLENFELKATRSESKRRSVFYIRLDGFLGGNWIWHLVVKSWTWVVKSWTWVVKSWAWVVKILKEVRELLGLLELRKAIAEGGGGVDAGRGPARDLTRRSQRER